MTRQQWEALWEQHPERLWYTVAFGALLGFIYKYML